MGMFDSILIQCNKCEREISFQSKVGKCKLKEYSLTHVPTVIAEDISGQSQLCPCGNKIVIINPNPISITAMIVKTIDTKKKSVEER